MCAVGIQLWPKLINEKLLGFNILGINAINVLGDIKINQSRSVLFTKEELPVCMAIQIYETDFNVNFEDK